MHKIPAPGSPRQTFELFHLYRPEVGLASLTERLDWTDVTPRQVYAAALGRLPERKQGALHRREYSARAHFTACLESPEFQEKIIRAFLNAYADKTRYLFVHIPKCAGTDFEVDLARRYPTLPHTLALPGVTPKPDLHAALARLSSETLMSDGVFVYGHLTLRWFLDTGLCRFRDRIFSIVREPVGIILALVNYVVTTLVQDPEFKRVDTASWRAMLGDTLKAAELSPPELVILARRVLHLPSIVHRNYLCTFLGDGTAASTLDPLATSNIEIADISRYTLWRRRVWGLGEGVHQNKSTPYLTEADLLPVDRDYIMHLTDEDRPFYHWVQRTLEGSQAPSFRGTDLVRKATNAN